MTGAAAGAVAWHALAPGEALSRLGSCEAGLSEAEAAARRARLGPNALPEPPRRSGLRVFAAQFWSPLIALLVAAAGLAFLLGERRDAAVIAGVLLVNALVGWFQESRAQRSMESLRRLASLRVTALRGGVERVLDARDLVPGDVVRLAAGDAVAADARLLTAARLQAIEGALTGESAPSRKQVEAVRTEAPPADRRDMVFAGTQLAGGRGTAVVVATGVATEVGRIALLTEGAREPRTPLERRVAQLGRTLAVAAVVVFGLVLGMGALRGLPFTAVLMVALSQLVSTVPEGLPVAMTVGLAVGMQRMARRGAVVRRLASVETLGSTTVICTDKTGTLTRNEMTVTALALPGRPLAEAGAPGWPPRAGEDPEVLRLLEAAALCNDAAPAQGPNGTALAGDPTETALLALAQEAGMDAADLRRRWPRSGEIPFSAEEKMMATAHSAADPTDGGAVRVAVKGAPERVLALCGRVRRGGSDVPIDEAARAEAAAASTRMAEGALRLLAVAEGEGALDPERGLEQLRGRLVFLGMVGELDPPRDGAAAAVRSCREAGVRTVMVTGDHLATGLAIARRVGIAGPGEAGLDGAALDALSDEALGERLAAATVLARVRPEQKLRVVEALQARGEVVAMTGDGVNDAPALARADVGVAMGRSGTEVAKEAAAIVLADDDFSTLVAAVDEGRVVYGNVRKALLLLLSTGAAEVAILVLSLAAGLPLPFPAVQILWNNVVTEGTITVNLAMEPGEGDEMRRPPIRRGQPLLGMDLVPRLLLMAATISAVTLGFFTIRLAQGVPLARAQTGAFTLLAVCEWLNVLNCRSATRSAFGLGLLRNRWLAAGLALSVALQAAVIWWRPLGDAFRTVPLSAGEVAVIVAAASLVLAVEEARKAFARRHRPLPCPPPQAGEGVLGARGSGSAG